MAIKFSFVMNVLNGEPFIEYQLAAIYPYAYEIVIVEGAYQKFSHASTPDGHSTDGTVEAIVNFPDPENKITLISKQGFWNDRCDMCNGFMPAVTGDVIWQADVDEFYWPWVYEYIEKLFDEDETLDQVSFRVREYFASLEYEVVGAIRVMGLSDVRRVHRFQPGERWSSQRPPTLVGANGKIKKIRKEITAEEMFHLGVFIFHPTTLFRKQTFDKFRYYRQMWVGIEQKDEWLYDTWDHFKNPLRLHGITNYASWIERYKDALPPLLEQMIADVRGGKFPGIEKRDNSDIEQYLQSPRYTKDVAMGRALNTLLAGFSEKETRAIFESFLVISYNFARSPFNPASRFCMKLMLNSLKTELVSSIKK